MKLQATVLALHHRAAHLEIIFVIIWHRTNKAELKIDIQYTHCVPKQFTAEAVNRIVTPVPLNEMKMYFKHISKAFVTVHSASHINCDDEVSVCV